MNPIGVPIPFPDDAMPPEGQYSSREELVTAINAAVEQPGRAPSLADDASIAAAVYDQGQPQSAM